MIRRRDFCLGLMAAPAIIRGAVAQPAFPSRTVRLIIPFAPGGSNDIVGRMIAQQLGPRLGQQVIVENSPGAGGTTGAGLVAKADPDGYTLLLISSSYAYNATLYKSPPYDPAKSFKAVAMFGTGPATLTVNPNLPVNTVGELIALAKKEPGKLLYSSGGVGSLNHLVMELFLMQAGINIVHVPYKGGGPAQTDLAAGVVQVLMATLIQSLPMIKNKQIKVLGTTGPKRTPVLPDVPTIAETLPGFEAQNWWGMLTPTGTPQAVIDKLHAETINVLQSEETRRRFATEGADVEQASRMSSADFDNYIRSEIDKWGKVIRSAKIQAN